MTMTEAGVSRSARGTDGRTALRRTVGRAALAARRNPVLVAVFAVLWGFALVPLWRPRLLPLLDLPNHLSAIAIWHRYGDPSWGYSKFYTLNLLPVPYWGYFFPVHLLSYVFQIEIANKIYLSAYLLAFPLGAALLAQRMGRSVWLSLFAFPLAFNFNFSFGFITYCAGATLLLYALWVLDRFLEAPSRGRAVALGLLTLALYTTHVLPWLFFGVAAMVLLFCHGWRPRRMLAAAGLMLPSLVLAMWGFHRAADGTTHVQKGELQFKANYESILEVMQQAPNRVLAGWPGSRVYLVLLVLGLVWLALMSTSRAAPGDARPGYRYRLELVFGLAVIACFALPIHQFKPVDLWMIGGRFVSLALVFGALLPRGTIDGRRRWWLVPLIVLAVYYPLRLSAQWRKFDLRAASFRRLMRFIPRGSSTLTLIVGEATDPAIEAQVVPYTQFHAYAQFYAGGFDPWVLNTGFPMIPRPDQILPAPTWKQASSFNFDAHGIHYDFLLTRGEPHDYDLFGPDDAGRAPLVGWDGEWRLYQVRSP
jgi:hypothetical protein